MSVQVVGEDIRVIPAGAFDGVGEVIAEAPSQLSGEERLVGAELACQKGRPILGVDCVACTRYRGYYEGPGPSQVTIRCAWSDRAPVWARMTVASAIVSVPPDLDCREANELARQKGIHHLIVSDGARLDGVVCGCDLRAAAAGERVRDRMARDVYAIRSRASLGEAIAAMSDLAISCLPVFDRGLLVGILTRGDLRRAGAPDELIGTRRCSTCGSHNGVRTDPLTGGDACLGCIAEGRSAELDAYEFGEGD
jgi:predicted transcriptional regulator